MVDRFMRRAAAAALVGVILSAGAARGEDGSRLWLRYDELPAAQRDAYRAAVGSLVVPNPADPTAAATKRELQDALSGLLGAKVPEEDFVGHDHALVVGTPKESPIIAGLKLDAELAKLGPDGFLIRTATANARPITVIAANTQLGALYGAFHYIRLLETLQPVDNLNVTSRPSFKLRVLDHWDNLNGSVERGYAGQSLWKWPQLPAKLDPRIAQYARFNASIGINGSVLNNVNASADSLKPEYLKKAAAIADAFRPYGVKVYLSARFSAPIDLGGLKTADPLDPAVKEWWAKKADEIYGLIPDFGGFLVKANSEGQPGPVTYHRSHADGANCLAAAVAPHGGVVMWRAFVYDAKPGSDRISQAYDTLKPFDGTFAANVLLQVKNGPLDFQPREPFHPLFGAMPKTQLMPELQVTQEYLGQSKMATFLAPMWREFLDSDTDGKGTTVLKTVTEVPEGRLTGIAAVANTGSDTNWTGHDLLQANWYAYGRLAWQGDASSKQIADEWTAMTLTREAAPAKTIESILLESREAMVDTMTPLGLTHIMWTGHHYGPKPWDDSAERPDWNPVYYHRASADGIGFDRTSTGSDAVAQYQPAVAKKFADLATCPDEYLLWFHHVPWTYKVHTGRTVWDELCLRYQRGVDWTRDARKRWESVKGAVDDERFDAIAKKLAIQERDAIVWRDACTQYFGTFSKMPLPEGVEKPVHTFDELKRVDPNRR